MQCPLKCFDEASKVKKIQFRYKWNLSGQSKVIATVTVKFSVTSLIRSLKHNPRGPVLGDLRLSSNPPADRSAVSR